MSAPTPEPAPSPSSPRTSQLGSALLPHLRTRLPLMLACALGAWSWSLGGEIQKPLEPPVLAKALSDACACHVKPGDWVWEEAPSITEAPFGHGVFFLGASYGSSSRDLYRGFIAREGANRFRGVRRVRRLSFSPASDESALAPDGKAVRRYLAVPSMVGGKVVSVSLWDREGHAVTKGKTTGWFAGLRSSFHRWGNLRPLGRRVIVPPKPAGQLKLQVRPKVLHLQFDTSPAVALPLAGIASSGDQTGAPILPLAPTPRWLIRSHSGAQAPPPQSARATKLPSKLPWPPKGEGWQTLPGQKRLWPGETITSSPLMLARSKNGAVRVAMDLSRLQLHSFAGSHQPAPELGGPMRTSAKLRPTLRAAFAGCHQQWSAQAAWGPGMVPLMPMAPRGNGVSPSALRFGTAGLRWARVPLERPPNPESGGGIGCGRSWLPGQRPSPGLETDDQPQLRSALCIQGATQAQWFQLPGATLAQITAASERLGCKVSMELRAGPHENAFVLLGDATVPPPSYAPVSAGHQDQARKLMTAPAGHWFGLSKLRLPLPPLPKGATPWQPLNGIEEVAPAHSAFRTRIPVRGNQQREIWLFDLKRLQAHVTGGDGEGSTSNAGGEALPKGEGVVFMGLSYAKRGGPGLRASSMRHRRLRQNRGDVIWAIDRKGLLRQVDAEHTGFWHVLQLPALLLNGKPTRHYGKRGKVRLRGGLAILQGRWLALALVKGRRAREPADILAAIGAKTVANADRGAHKGIWLSLRKPPPTLVGESHLSLRTQGP